MRPRWQFPHWLDQSAVFGIGIYAVWLVLYGVAWVWLGVAVSLTEAT